MAPRSRTNQAAPSVRASSKTGARRNGDESARVYESLRRQILDGKLDPGTHLSQHAIALAEGTSNGPVINALRQLAFEGLLVHEPSQGYSVCDWSEDGLDDLLNVRRALETEAARLAARRAGKDDIDGLRKIITRMEQLVAEQRWQDADAIDVELHVEIARLSRSPRLIECLARSHLLEVVRRRIALNERITGFSKLAQNHRILVDAIASGDADRAAAAMHAHLLGKRSAA
ncbi:MAG: GntR family transcriptional regulator [Planctomycetes bacterium]|nr:GntR family transcriptional regulator [Planctomycetota bacterium]